MGNTLHPLFTLFHLRYLHSLQPSFHCFSVDTVDVETLFCFLSIRGKETLLGSANTSKRILALFRLLNKVRIMTHGINNTDDSGSKSP